MNKKAIEKIMTVWWFSVWVIIIIAVVVNVAIFTTRDVEYREIDAEILANKIVLCLNQEKIDFSRDYETKDIIKECNFKINTFEEGIHSFKIIKYGENKEILKELVVGSASVFVQCEVKANAQHYAKCYQKEYLIKQAGKYYTFEIVTASNTNGERTAIEKIK
jgi:hypothetical protein